jgi:hypothetical protein
MGLDSEVLDPHRALTSLEPGDVALARLDVREGLDGIERGSGELERLAAGGVDVRNPPAALVVAHDKLLTARTLRHAGLPHPHTTLISSALPAAVPELPLVLKPRFGSGGRDVELCSTADELDEILIRLQRKPWFREHGALAQELVEPRGWDLRIVVAGAGLSAPRAGSPGRASGGRTLRSVQRLSPSSLRRLRVHWRLRRRGRRGRISSASTSCRRGTDSSCSS